MADDGIRERHGVTVQRSTGGDVGITMTERVSYIEMPSCAETRHVSPAQARYLARKLYHLARRIEQRQQQAA